MKMFIYLICIIYMKIPYHCHIYIKGLCTQYTHSLFTCNFVFSSLYLFLTQPQRGCLRRLHINPMEILNDSCQCSRGTVRPESSNLIKTICYDKLHQQHYDVLDLPFSLYCCSVISLSNHYLLHVLVHYSASLIETISNVPALTKDITM